MDPTRMLLDPRLLGQQDAAQTAVGLQGLQANSSMLMPQLGLPNLQSLLSMPMQMPLQMPMGMPLQLPGLQLPGQMALPLSMQLPLMRQLQRPAGPSRAPDGPSRRLGPPYQIKQFEYCSPHDGNGIVYSLGLDKRSGKWQNPVETKTLRVCASSLQGGNLSCSVDHDLNGVLFQTDDQPYSWCIFDFQECSVRPNYYTLAHRSVVNAFFMRSWQLEGSSDNSTWQILSRHNNDESLNPNSLVAAWALHAKAFYRYLRIVLDPNGNSEGGSSLLFNCFDVYGEFKVPTGTAPSGSSRGSRGQQQGNDDRRRGNDDRQRRGQGNSFGDDRRGGKKRGWEDDDALQRNDDFDLRNVAPINILDFRGRLVDHCQTQEGSRQLQARLVSHQCSREEVELLHDEILPNVVQLMANKFGNYVVQKLMENGTNEQRKSLAKAMQGNILSLASQLYGCFVLQTALEVLDEEDRYNIACELKQHVLECIDHHHANHVLRKCLDVLPFEKVDFIVSNLEGNVEEVAKHVYGCRLLQLMLIKYKDNVAQIQKVVDELVQAVSTLACDTYGNYVVQHLVVYGDPYYRSNVHLMLLSKIVGLLQHQAASHVIEKMYEHGNREERSAILHGILDECASTLPQLMRDKYANHVLQRMIDFSDKDEAQRLRDAMLPHADVLKEEVHGKYLLLRLQGKWQARTDAPQGWSDKKGSKSKSFNDDLRPQKQRHDDSDRY